MDGLTRFEITDQRLSQGLLDGAGILRLPSNAELGEPETKVLYKPTYLLWHGSGALKNIYIKCPSCQAEINLGRTYSTPWHCSGRSPEKEGEGNRFFTDCQEDARIIQRGAANLRIPEIASSLVIPQCDTNLHRLFQISVIYDVLLARKKFPFTSKQEMLDTLGEFVQRKKNGTRDNPSNCELRRERNFESNQSGCQSGDSPYGL